MVARSRVRRVWVWVAVVVVVAIVAGTVWRAVSGQGAATADHPPGAPTGLTVDDASAPLAVEGTPQFGWVVNDVDRGETQSGYQIVVATQPTTDPRDRHVVWTSGRVASGQQAYVDANGLRLAPGSEYFWTVRTWDRAGRGGPFARPAGFGVGLGDGDWHASWIRRPGIDPEASEDFTLARTERHLGASPIVRAVAYVSAGQQYDLRVNGVRVAHGPSFSYPDEQYYETTDITRATRTPGRANAIGIITHWSNRPDRAARPRCPDSSRASRSTTPTGPARSSRPIGPGALTSGPWVPGPLRNDEGDLRRAHRRARRPDRLGPARLRRPRLGPRGRARPASRSRRSCISSRRAVTSSNSAFGPRTLARLARRLVRRRLRRRHRGDARRHVPPRSRRAGR